MQALARHLEIEEEEEEEKLARGSSP